MPLIDIREDACSASSVIEVNSAKASPEFERKTAQDDTDVVRIDVVDSVCAGNRYRKLDPGKPGG